LLRIAFSEATAQEIRRQNFKHTEGNLRDGEICDGAGEDETERQQTIVCT
jgi:hypothetical protein